MKEQERICKELGNKGYLSFSLGNQALILKDWGQLDEGHSPSIKRKSGLAESWGIRKASRDPSVTRALILSDWGQLDEAMALNKEAERICKELGNKNGLAHAIGNQANILYARGELDEAMRLLKEQEQICRNLGKKKRAVGLPRQPGIDP